MVWWIIYISIIKKKFHEHRASFTSIQGHPVGKVWAKLDQTARRYVPYKWYQMNRLLSMWFIYRILFLKYVSFMDSKDNKTFHNSWINYMEEWNTTSQVIMATPNRVNIRRQVLPGYLPYPNHGHHGSVRCWRWKWSRS